MQDLDEYANKVVSNFDVLDEGRIKTILSAIGNIGDKVGERLLAKRVGTWLARDQDAASVVAKGGRDDIQKEVLKYFSDTPKGNKRLQNAISGNARIKHGVWGLTQHMEKNPEFQDRVLSQLIKNDPTDRRINFLSDRKKVNDYLRQNYPDKFDDIRDMNKIYDPKTKNFRNRVSTDPVPGFKPDSAGQNTIVSAGQARARLRPGAPDENPYLRKAVAATRATTQPSFTNNWTDVPVPKRKIVDKVIDKMIGAKYDEDGSIVLPKK
jgi:hypothetical protein